MEKISFTDMLVRHGLREDRLLEAFRIGGSATSDLKPSLTPVDPEVVVGEGMATFLDPDGMRALVDEERPAS